MATHTLKQASGFCQIAGSGPNVSLNWTFGFTGVCYKTVEYANVTVKVSDGCETRVANQLVPFECVP